MKGDSLESERKGSVPRKCEYLRISHDNITGKDSLRRLLLSSGLGEFGKFPGSSLEASF